MRKNNNMRFAELTINSIHQGLINKEFTCQELVSEYLRWIKLRQNDINAFITVTEEMAMQQAQKVDEKINAGKEIGILEGVPAAIKDNFLVEDILASAGSKILSNYIAPYDATAVKRLRTAGVIFLGKTNCDEFAMGSSGETSAFGATKNPLDEERVPGGSSSGSAAAVGDNQCVFALGSDTGGSIRQPASFCGVVGLKPTYGRVSRHGLIALASSLDHVGSLTKNALDAAQVLQTISGADDFDSTAVDQQDDFLSHIDDDLRGFKFGIPKEYFIKGMDERVAEVVLQAIDKLRYLGAKVIEVSLPHTQYSLATYYILQPAEAAANLARYDGVKYGLRIEGENLEDMYIKTRSYGFGDEVKRRIMLGTYVLTAGYADDFYKTAQKMRTLIKQDFDQVFKKVDCLLTPTSPSVAFKLGEKFSNPLTMYLADIFTVSANIAGVPAISVPCGRVDNLPVGLQIIGNYFEEAKILQVAHGFEKG